MRAFLIDCRLAEIPVLQTWGGVGRQSMILISGCMIKDFTSLTRFLKMWRLREYPISRKLRMAGMDTSNFTGEMHAYRDQSSSTKHRYQPGPHIHGHEPAWGDRATGRRRGLRHRHPLYQRVSSLHKSPTMGAGQLQPVEFLRRAHSSYQSQDRN